MRMLPLSFLVISVVLRLPAQTKVVHTVDYQLDAQVTQAEIQVLSLAEVMPEDKYTFVPTAGSFKGVRTFAEQLKHIAANNCSFWGAAAHGACSSKIETSDGPAAVKSKAQIIALLRESFALGHRAALALTADNATDDLPIEDGGHAPRLFLITSALSHNYDHYGQLVVYLRMNGIVPPASRR